MILMIFSPGISLLFNDPLHIATGPQSAPRMIRPAQTKRKIRLARFQDFLERTFQQAFASKPVMPVTEGLDSMSVCHLCLGRSYFWNAQVIKAKVRGQLRLIMAAKKR